MEEFSYQYVAGFLDGEGCVSVYAKSGSRGHGIQVQIVQRAHKQSRQLFAAIQESFGGKIREQKLANGSVKLCLDFHGDNAATFLERISPSLYLKREQAIIALAWQKSRSSRSRDERGRLVPITDECYQSNCLVARCLSHLKRHTWLEYCEVCKDDAASLICLDWWPFKD